MSEDIFLFLLFWSSSSYIVYTNWLARESEIKDHEGNTLRKVLVSNSSWDYWTEQIPSIRTSKKLFMPSS